MYRNQISYFMFAVYVIVFFNLSAELFFGKVLSGIFFEEVANKFIVVFPIPCILGIFSQRLTISSIPLSLRLLVSIASSIIFW